jgi:hypothetical protein
MIDVSGILIDNSRVILQIVVSLTDNSRSIIYGCNMFIVQATSVDLIKPFMSVIYKCL